MTLDRIYQPYLTWEVLRILEESRNDFTITGLVTVFDERLDFILDKREERLLRERIRISLHVLKVIGLVELIYVQTIHKAPELIAHYGRY